MYTRSTMYPGAMSYINVSSGAGTDVSVQSAASQNLWSTQGSTLKKKSSGRNSIALRLSEATVRSRALRLLSLGPFEGFRHPVGEIKLTAAFCYELQTSGKSRLHEYQLPLMYQQATRVTTEGKSNDRLPLLRCPHVPILIGECIRFSFVRCSFATFVRILRRREQTAIGYFQVSLGSTEDYTSSPKSTPSALPAFSQRFSSASGVSLAGFTGSAMSHRASPYSPAPAPPTAHTPSLSYLGNSPSADSPGGNATIWSNYDTGAALQQYGVVTASGNSASRARTGPSISAAASLSASEYIDC
ncbi:hypothetical protein ANN_26140 [Periplaneta americana]|uniref:Uncharacterized protein n=1 Tax=Periplaneta americana TaxID=6978 RepID=A0ABQ8S5I3_PERAM|nr:hypothetical protein ANN_26140 [Periplaneta americana]